jgi:Rha family phage regulatory protein
MQDTFDLISVTDHNGMISTTSLNIAKVFEKDHCRVLKDIRRAIETVEAVTRSDEGAKLPSPRKTRLVFAETTYTSDQGKELPMYLLNRDATVFLIMSYTGTRAAAFKLGYIEAFDQMEEAKLKNANSAPITSTPAQALISGPTYEMYREARDVLDTLSDYNVSREDIKLCYIKGKMLERLAGVNPFKEFFMFQAIGDWVLSEPDENWNMHPISKKESDELWKAKRLANRKHGDADDSLYDDVPF